MRDEFNIRPSLTPFQFLSNGFAERKMLLLYDTIGAARKKVFELEGRKNVRRKKRRVPRSQPQRIASNVIEKSTESAVEARNSKESEEVKWGVVAHKKRLPNTSSTRQSNSDNSTHASSDTKQKRVQELEAHISLLKYQLDQTLVVKEELKTFYEKALSQQREQIETQRAEIEELRKECSEYNIQLHALQEQNREKEQQARSQKCHTGSKDADSPKEELHSQTGDEVKKEEANTGFYSEPHNAKGAKPHNAKGDSEELGKNSIEDNTDEATYKNDYRYFEERIKSFSISDKGEGGTDGCDYHPVDIDLTEEDDLNQDKTSPRESFNDMNEFISRITTSLQESKAMLSSRGYIY